MLVTVCVYVNGVEVQNTKVRFVIAEDIVAFEISTDTIRELINYCMLNDSVPKVEVKVFFKEN